MPVSLPRCPVCSDPLEITEGTCRACDVQVRGHFGSGRFDALSSDQAAFLEAFLRCRGVIRDIEAVLGISYPTVKSRLEAMLTTLGLQDHPLEAPARDTATPADPATVRRTVLEAVKRGELTSEEGMRRLQGLN